MIQQPYATLRDLDEFGVAAESLAMLTPAHKRRGILAASGRIAGYLRPKHSLPLTPDVTPLDTALLVVGGSAALSLVGTPQLVQDLAVKVVAPGVVGVDPVTIQLSTDAGATYGPEQLLASNGVLVVDGVALTLVGSLGALDQVEWSTCVDRGLCEATVAIATYILLNNRGIPAETMETVEARWLKADKWASTVAAGEAFLDGKEDATPELDEGGGYGDGQINPWDFLDVVLP